MYDHCPRCYSPFKSMLPDLREYDLDDRTIHVLVLECSQCDCKITGGGTAHTTQARQSLEAVLEQATLWWENNRGKTIEDFDNWCKKNL